MNLRTSSSANETFRKMLIDCKNQGVKAKMILDDSGLERAEGLIQELHFEDPHPYVKLDDGRTIAENTIVALNGVFHPDFSGC